MMTYYIKVITGYREDQFVTIPMQEAHKAYYLFNHADERGVFDCGVALIGRNIQEIKPDYNTTMGWKPTHELNSDDWEELNNKGIEAKMKLLLQKARDVAKLAEKNPEIMKYKKLGEAMKLLDNKTTEFISENTNLLSEKFKIQ